MVVGDISNLVTRVKDATIDITMETADNTAIRDRWKTTKPIAMSASLSFTEAVENASGAGLGTFLQIGKLLDVTVKPYDGTEGYGGDTPSGEVSFSGKFYITSVGYQMGREGHEIRVQAESCGEVKINNTAIVWTE